MTIPQPDHLQVLAVLLVDIRATADAQKRAVTNAQSSVEQFRHTGGTELLDDIADCLNEVATNATAVGESASEAEKALSMLKSGIAPA